MPQLFSLSSWANLKSTTYPTLNAGDLAVLQDYSTPGDLGGGTFFWDTSLAWSSVNPDNSGTIASVAAQKTGAWRRIYDGGLSVRWFGATGNGSTDDTSAINSAIKASITAGGGTVFFDLGTYVTSGGSGPNTTTLPVTSATNLNLIGDGAIIEQGGSGSVLIGIYGSRNIKVKGLKLIGWVPNIPAVSSAGNALISINDSSDSIIIEDCYLTNSLGDGIYVGGPQSTEGNLGFTSKHVIITHNTIKTRYGNGIPSSTAGGSKSRTAIALIDTDGVIITDNIIYGGIDVEPNWAYQGVRFVNISDNQFLEGPVSPQYIVSAGPNNYDEPIIDDGGIFRPMAAPTLTLVTGSGSMPAGNYYAVITYATSTTETVASQESTLLTVPSGPSTYSIMVTGGAVPTGATTTQVNVYLTPAGVGSGSEVFQNSYSGAATSITLTSFSSSTVYPPRSLNGYVTVTGKNPPSDTNFNLIQGNYFDVGWITAIGDFLGNIVGNQFKFGYIQIGAIGNTSGAYTPQVVVTGNIFTFIAWNSPQPAALQFENIATCTVQGNTLEYGTGQHLMYVAYGSGGGFGQNTFQLNRFLDTTGAGLLTSGNAFNSTDVVNNNYIASAPFVSVNSSSSGSFVVNPVLSNTFILIENSAASGSTTVNLPVTPPIGTVFTVKDALGNAATIHINVTPASGTIEGVSPYPINTNYGHAMFLYNGTAWNVVG